VKGTAEDAEFLSRLHSLPVGSDIEFMNEQSVWVPGKIESFQYRGKYNAHQEPPQSPSFIKISTDKKDKSVQVSKINFAKRLRFPNISEEKEDGTAGTAVHIGAGEVLILFYAVHYSKESLTSKRDLSFSEEKTETEQALLPGATRTETALVTVTAGEVFPSSENYYGVELTFTGTKREQTATACALCVRGKQINAIGTIKLAEYLPGVPFDENGRVDKEQWVNFQKSPSIQETLGDIETSVASTLYQEGTVDHWLRKQPGMVSFYERKSAQSNSRRKRFEAKLLESSVVEALCANEKLLSTYRSQTIAYANEDISARRMEAENLILSVGKDSRDKVMRLANTVVSETILYMVRGPMFVVCNDYAKLILF
jgi:hypothetical protein